MKNYFTIFATAVSICLMLSSCGEPQTQVQLAANQKILLMGNSADPSTLDPTLSTGLPEFKILSGLFEGLVRADEKTLEVLPAIAKSWKISPDKKIYTFYLDKNAKWSDGEPVKASDFEFAWKRAVSPKIASEYATLHYCIKNARAINLGKEKDISKLGVKSLDTHTLEVELETPVPYFLNMLYLNVFYPLPEHVLKKFGADKTRNSIWTRAGNMVSNGAFTLEKWKINELVYIKKNPNYREADKIKINGIKFFPIGNANTEDRAFRSGQLHITDSVALPRIDSIKKKFATQLRKSDWLGTYFYIFNTRRPPLDNPKVRKALSISINRQVIIDAFLKVGQTPAYSIVPPNCSQSWRKNDQIKFSEDLTQAKELLAQAGYSDISKFPKLKLVYNTSEIHKPIAEAIQQMWKNNLGIDVELYNLSWPAYIVARSSGDFDIARSSWIGDFDAPETFLSLFDSASELSNTGYADKSYDNLLQKASNAKSNKERIEFLKLAENKIAEDMPIIPIYYYARVYLISHLVKNWNSNILDYHNYRNVDFESQQN